MKHILMLLLTLILFKCGNKNSDDPVDEYDRLDLANTVDTTKGTYNPSGYSTYIFPADSSDIETVTEYSDYTIKTILFPVRSKYVILYHESLGRKDKIKFRDYKLQVEISNHEGLYIKKVISKYDIPDSIMTLKPDYHFLRNVNFKGLTNDEFRFDLKVSSSDEDKPTRMIKYYINLDEGLRYENYPKTYYDSLNPEPDEF